MPKKAENNAKYRRNEMISNKLGLKGQVTVKVLDANGNLKRFPEHPILKHLPLTIQELAEKYLNIPVSGREMIVVNHNIVTDEGDALVADQLADSPGQTKVDSTNGYIEVGTGFTSESKSATSCTTPTGSPEIMDAGYPQTQGAFGAANDNILDYRATFEAGDLNQTGIDEAALLNNSSAAAADCLAYAEISPAVNVTTADTLEVTWSLTFTGS